MFDSAPAEPQHAVIEDHGGERNRDADAVPGTEDPDGEDQRGKQNDKRTAISQQDSDAPGLFPPTQTASPGA